MDEEIRELLEKTARTRHALLRTQLQTVITAAEMAKLQLSQGNMAAARHEVATAENGARVIENFAARLPPEHRAEMEAGLASLRATLDAVKAELNA